MNKYITYIIIIVLAAAVGFTVFRFIQGPGELVEDFDLRGGFEKKSGLLSDMNTLEQIDNINNTQTTDDNESAVLAEKEYTEIGEEIMVTDGIKHLVPLDKIRGGGPAKDGIPSIDDPKFTSVAQADEFLDDDKLGIAVEKNGDWRFYSFQILVWHEIVNEEFKGEPILVTYCPLCQTGIVFKPIVEGEAVEFGTSGRLFNSNLVMYDRKTDTLWSQQGGRAIVGKQTGARLEIRAADNVFWGEFKKAHPEAEVLSRDTGQNRNYTSDPYGNYYSTSGTYFPVENTDDRLFDKAIVYGLEVKGQFKAYSEEAIKRDEIVNDIFNGLSIVVVIEPETQAVRFYNRKFDSQTLSFELDNGGLVDNETGSEWDFNGVAIAGALLGTRLERINPEFGFWFAWVAFNPETELYN